MIPSHSNRPPTPSPVLTHSAPYITPTSGPGIGGGTKNQTAAELESEMTILVACGRVCHGNTATVNALFGTLGGKSRSRKTPICGISKANRLGCGVLSCYQPKGPEKNEEEVILFHIWFGVYGNGSRLLLHDPCCRANAAIT